MKTRIVFLPVWFLLFTYSLWADSAVAGAGKPSAAATERPFQIIYFMSFGCAGCREVLPLVNALHDEAQGKYQLTARVYGTPKDEVAAKANAQGVKFPLVAGTKAERLRYGAQSTPMFVLLDGKGWTKERYQGVNGAERLAKVLRGGHYQEETGLMELAIGPAAFTDKNLIVRGLLRNSGKDYFKAAEFVLSNGREKVRVKPWAPLEVAPKVPGGKAARGQVMSDFLGKEVRVKGVVRVEAGRPVIAVSSAEVIP